ncbi:MAG: hypothetical protein ACYTGL_01840 [Planctomycetota bacterium]
MTGGVASERPELVLVAQREATESQSRPKREAGPSPFEHWFQYFKQNRPPADDLRRVVAKLLEAKQYEQIVAFLQAALANGQAEPWMFDVLAMAMRLADYPQAEIQRVLMSRVDLSPTDIDGLLYSAAFLSRLEASQAALRVYQEAARLAPSRPEPYVLGLKLARSLKDAKGIQWAASGILTSVWVRGFERHHQTAEDALLDKQQELNRAGQNKDAEELAAALAEAKRRDLIVRVEWSGDGDLDLTVEEPCGAKCSTHNPQTAGGGAFTHDGYGPEPDNCFEEYVCVRGSKGDYRATIEHIDGNIVGKSFRVTWIRYRGSENEQSKTETYRLDKPRRVIRFTLNDGRRTELVPGLPVPGENVSADDDGASKK